MLPNELTDICFNFTHQAFRSDERGFLDRALAAGVTTMLVTGSDIEESKQAIALAKKYPQFLFATAGVHPHLARDWPEAGKRELLRLCQAREIVAVGECGLDYNRDFSPREQQRQVFREQLEVAAATGLPAFCHEREAHTDFISIVKEFRQQLSAVVVHCFTGKQAELEAYLEIDCHIGITGWICDERRGHHLRDFMSLIPAGRLMIETDAPYLLPRDLNPKAKTRVNEPQHLPHIASAVASARGEPTATLIAHTTATAKDFFNLES